MKRLLMASLAVLVMLGAAFAQDAKTTNNQSAQDSNATAKQAAQPELKVKTVVITPENFDKLSPEMRQKLRTRIDEAFATLPFSPNVCYTMNSYVFERYDGGDAMRLVKHSTCTPGSQFRVKKATVTSVTTTR